MNTTSVKNIRQLSMIDARRFATARLSSATDDLLVIDDISHFDFSEQALHMSFLIFCYCTSGRCHFTVNSQTLCLESGDLFIGVGEQILAKKDVSNDFSAKIILVSHECMQDSIVGLHQLWPFLLYIYKHPVIHLDAAERIWVEGSYTEVLRRVKAYSHRYRRESVTALIRLFYFDMCDVLARRAPVAHTQQTSSYNIFDKFIHLLSDNFRSERNVSWYSDQLCLTPKYLSEVVKNVSGRTAGQWIANFVVMEIKQLLANTSLSVKEIAVRLNFSNQSFLGKYFKNATGFSPSDYRK